MATDRVEVFLCGELFRRDDGVAAAAGRLLPDEAIALANIHEVGELSVEALLAVPPDAVVIVVDAVAGIEPGRVRRLPLSKLARQAVSGSASSDSSGSAASSHVLPLPTTLALAAEIRGVPVRGTFIGIGAADLGYGEGLSAVTEAGLPALVDAIRAEIERLAQERSNGRIGP